MWPKKTEKKMLIKFRSDILIVLFSVFFTSIDLNARDQQNLLTDSATINECLKYAFRNQPLVKQLKLDEGITNQNIRIALADWLPQITSGANLQHYLKQPVLLFPDISNPAGPKILIPSGVLYNSGISLSATQNIFNADVYIAGRTARTYRLQSAQTSKSALTEMVIEISKAFYDVLLSEEQLNLINEEITRLTKTLKDAYTHFQNGTNDIIDYKRATISLSNAMAQKKSAIESINMKNSYLKQLIGYPGDKVLNLASDIRSLKKEILIDTLQYLDVNNRIEYQLLETNLKLQKSKIEYYRFGLLPSLSAFANYNYVFQNDQFSALYKTYYPNSTIGLTVSLPIFEGTKRLRNIRKARMEYERMALDTINTRNEMNTQYVSAMASYKANLELYKTTSQNIDIAKEVYNTVKLQYDQGIKSYLEVIVSETDLMSARINNLNALFMLMFSKLDVQRASGSISIDY
jgi:outer membrane protein